tara:strand:- start:1082 stop:1369 length:288 start_codon:yes stop_codon:yes gene_type:complete
MNNLKVRSLFFMLIATNVFANDSDFYTSARAILGDMVEIESTREKGLATSVSNYAESVLLNNGFEKAISKLLAQQKHPKVYMPSIVVGHLKIPSL